MLILSDDAMTTAVEFPVSKFDVSQMKRKIFYFVFVLEKLCVSLAAKKEE